MPVYVVQHSVSLTDEQQDALAQRITDIHSRLFVVPAALAHVSFVSYAATPHYIGGKRATGKTNMIFANVRTGGSRTPEQFEQLCRAIEDAWTSVVTEGVKPKTMDGRGLTGVFVLGTYTAAYEQGFMIPAAGKDQEWLAQNVDAFKHAAKEGNEVIAELLEELTERDEFKNLL
ncbi:putative cis-3-chloroacrylic acid protein [Favolaschia claudopus]|uniref:Cis-3-chloroacrylic acid protein n=1 Tax=Favolaschia claudopus TaxID=2862362 RepID=A0AAW0D5C5_9AGAR